MTSLLLRHPFRWIAMIFGTLAIVSARSATTTDWPMHRGNPSLSGVTPAKISAPLKLRWKRKTDAPVSGSAAIVQDTVYIGSEDSNFVAVALSDGKVKWNFKASAAIESTPLVLSGKVYFGDSFTNFYCLDAATGETLWSQGSEGEFKGGANFVTNAGSAASIIAGSWDNRLYSWNADTGKSNWIYETGNRINGAPAVNGGVTVFGGCDAIVHVLGTGDGIKRKEIDAGAYIAASACLLDGRAYVGHYENEFLCVDLEAGRIAWRYKDRNFPFMSSPAVTKDRVFVGNRDKKLHCISRADGTAVWTFPTKGKIEGSPVVAGDKVVFGSDDGRLYVLQATDGRELWSYEIGSAIQSSPAVVAGAVVIGATDGFIYCFGN